METGGENWENWDQVEPSGNRWGKLGKIGTEWDQVATGGENWEKL